MNPYKPGRRVYWHDPDNGACSAAGSIVVGIEDAEYEETMRSTDSDLDLDDHVILVVNDAGGEIECLAREIDLSCVSTGIHGDLTFGFGKPDCNGYFAIGDPVGAREAEKAHKVPVGSYWPFP